MIKHAYLIEARGHPGHDVIRNFYQSQGLEDGKIYNRQLRCIGEDEWVTKKFKDKDGNEKEQEGWKGGDGENTVNLHQLIQGTYTQMVNTFSILQKEGRRFTPGVATMWTRGEFGKMFEDPIFNTFNTVLEMVVKFHKNDYDGYLRRIRKDKKQPELIDKKTPTAEELIERFSQAREENIQAAKDRINSKEYENTKYFIRPIIEHDDLLRYKDFCYSSNVWCLMNGEGAWNHYTSNGIYQFYLVLDKRLCNENGDPILENKDIISPKEGNGHPNDEYGLSMMGIIVDEDGELAYCTTRWNHAGRGTDHTMDIEQISNTLGVNFYQTFKPNTNFQEIVDKTLVMYRKNGSLDAFDHWFDTKEKDVIIIEINNRFNLFNKNNGLISDKWFNYIEEVDYGLFGVKYKNKWNFIDINGNLICKTWFFKINGFKEGFSAVKINKDEKCWNYINKNGEFISDIWFDFAYDFRNGYATVYIIDKGFNAIDKQGNYITDIWSLEQLMFIDGLSIVKNTEGYNLINTNGELLYNRWFYNIQKTNKNVYKAEVKNKGFILINKNGELISKKYFLTVLEFTDDILAVEVKNKGWNLININGEFLLNIWLDFINPYSVFNFLNKKIFQVRIKNVGYFYLDKQYNLYKFNENNKLDFVKNISKKQKSNKVISNESLRRKYAKELNEVLDLNKRIKRLYE